MNRREPDPMRMSDIESAANEWLMEYTRYQNEEKQRIYDRAVHDWRLNDQRCLELGIERPPQPTAPVLDPVEPMPAGWWFRS
jgi:hypothetical protein